MIGNSKFLNSDKDFWANVRTISEALGYVARGERRIRVYSIEQIKDAMHRVNLSSEHLEKEGSITNLGGKLIDYFEYRAEILNHYVEPRLMNVERAYHTFDNLKNELNPTCPIPMNKQKYEKKAPAFFTGIINMLIEANSNGHPVNYDPRNLTTITRNDAPLRTLARRVDGCFPSHINPIAVWEIKEYYYTTTFGSRVADGVYETLLDGLEIEELHEHTGIDIKHYMMIDSHYTWWRSGKSYLCRIIDMLNMGYVDEVLFGYEVVERLPDIVKDWIKIIEDKQ